MGSRYDIKPYPLELVGGSLSKVRTGETTGDRLICFTIRSEFKSGVTRRGASVVVLLSLFNDRITQRASLRIPPTQRYSS